VGQMMGVIIVGIDIDPVGTVVQNLWHPQTPTQP
jgi:hypothetical protein